MVVSGRREGLKDVARAAGPKASEILVLPVMRRDGLRFWQACYGTYPSRAQAWKAWAKAPEGLRRAFKDAYPTRLPGVTPVPPSDPTRE
jgi:hypothetical protein